MANDRPANARKLSELEASFIKLTDERGSYRTDVTFADCDGVQFLCPLCFDRNAGPVGTHMVICWKPQVPQTISPTPGRWNHQGSGLHDLTLVAGSSSIALQGGCGWHGFVGFSDVPPGEVR
jgi:hypothetical protein